MRRLGQLIRGKPVPPVAARRHLAANTALDVKSAFPSSYDPAEVEGGWYEFWTERVLGRGDPKRPFSMLLPPPNVTGSLHIGHALTVSAQDAIARWHRMEGRDVAWIPGLDHAGIATQSVVERWLAANEGLNPRDLSREELLSRVEAWVEQYGGRIHAQLRSTGALLDWDKEFFTLDEPRKAAVVEAFVRLCDTGLLSRRSRLVQWCPHLQTALSDVEVDVEQIDGPTELALPGNRTVTVGQIETFRYPLVLRDTKEPVTPSSGLPSHLSVSTTRLETMLADEGVAVHPADPRFSTLLDRADVALMHPITGRLLPIVSDETLVDMELGTGCVKLTPSHDANDMAAAERTGLPMGVYLWDEAGRLTNTALDTLLDASPSAVAASAREMAGSDRFAVRAWLREQLSAAGLYTGAEPHPMAIAICSRSGDILEPALRPQWYVATGEVPRGGDRSMADMALAMATPPTAATPPSDASAADMPILPESGGREWQRWLSAPQPWCVSRQLAWGHRIPAFWAPDVRPGPQVDEAPAAPEVAGPNALPPGCDLCSRLHWATVGEANGVWVVARSEAEARSVLAAAAAAGMVQPPEGGAELALSQDEDVLDTWFSSGLLPLSALGWPHHPAARRGAGIAGELDPALARYYPMSLQETGNDILFFWAARMAMLCGELERSAPLFAGEQATLTPSVEPRPPFEQVWLHQLVRDKWGRKMSKSLGNVLDPVAVIEGRSLDEMQAELRATNLPAAELDRSLEALASDYPSGLKPMGVDALRLALCWYMQQGVPINLDVERVHQARLFCNKMWNAARFVGGAVEQAVGNGRLPAGVDPRLMLDDRAATAFLTENQGEVETPLLVRWAVRRAQLASAGVRAGLEGFDLGGASRAAHGFFLNDLCDVVIEWSKPQLYGEGLAGGGDAAAAAGTDAEAAMQRTGVVAAGLVHCLSAGLRLLHPFTPYVTEELWQRTHSQLGRGSDDPVDVLGLTAPPAQDNFLGTTDADMAHFEMLLAITRAGRSLRNQARDVLGKDLANPLPFLVLVGSDAEQAVVNEHRRELGHMLRAAGRPGAVEASTAASSQAPAFTAQGEASGLPAGVSMHLLLPVDAPGLASKLRQAVAQAEKRLKKRQKQIDPLRRRISAAESFAAAPVEVQQQVREQLAEREESFAAEKAAAEGLRRLAAQVE